MADSVAGSGRWAWRLAVAAGVAFILGPIAAHLGIVPPMAGFGLFGLGGLLGLIAAVVSLIAVLRHGGETRALATRGLVCAGLVSVVFLSAAVPGRRVPPINDITTDVQNAPEFVAAKALPANTARDMSYPGGYFTEQQKAGYPDLGPLLSSEPPDAAFERVVEVAAGMPGWEIIRTDRTARALEGNDTTWLFRFVDDFVIEVRPHEGGSAVHMRSKSRDGRGDIGANAARIRALFAALGG